MPAWKNKRPNNFDPIKKQNKFHKNRGNNHRGYQGNNYKGFKPQYSTVSSNVPKKTEHKKKS